MGRNRIMTGMIVVLLMFDLAANADRACDYEGDKRLRMGWLISQQLFRATVGGDESSVIMYDNERVDEEVKEDDRERFYLDCLRMDRSLFWFESGVQRSCLSNLCHHVVGDVMYNYQDDGVIPAEYKRALLSRYNFNQALVEFEICGYDLNRCPRDVQERAFTYWKDSPHLRIEHEHRWMPSNGFYHFQMVGAYPAAV